MLMLLNQLKEIKENPTKKLSNDLLNKDEYLHYNVEKGYFEYEDGTFLGKEPMDVVRLLQGVPFVKDAQWYFI